MLLRTQRQFADARWTLYGCSAPRSEDTCVTELERDNKRTPMLLPTEGLVVGSTSKSARAARRATRLRRPGRLRCAGRMVRWSLGEAFFAQTGATTLPLGRR